VNFNIGDLYFSATTTTFVLGIVAIVAVATVCLFAYFRAIRKWRYDDSYSMNSLDAKVSSIFKNPGDQQIITRKEWVKEALKDQHWKKLTEGAENTKIIKVPFSVDNQADINRSGSDYHKALNQTLDENDNLKAIIVLGDGDYNTGGEPLTVAQKAKSNKVPIYTIGVGKDVYLPDLEIISLSAPKFGIVGEAIQIPFTIRSSINKDLKTTVTLKEKNSSKQEVKSITIPANESSYNNSILFRLDKERNYDFELTVKVQAIEVLKNNNTQKFSLDAKKENIKVLVVESKPRWEYRFIRNALSRDPGVDLDCLLLHPGMGAGDGPDYIKNFPDDLAELQKYDVIFLGDVGIGPEQLTIEQADLIKGLVENQASGLVFIPGSQGNIFSILQRDPEDEKKPITELADLLPVVLDPKNKKGHNSKLVSSLSLTENGKSSLLTMLGDSADQNTGIWRNLPGFYWHAPVLKAKLGTEVLAVHPKKRGSNNQRLPMLVTKTHGGCPTSVTVLQVRTSDSTLVKINQNLEILSSSRQTHLIRMVHR